MDLLSPENIAQLTALLAEVSEDAAHILIAYFAIPVVLKIVGVMGWLLTIFAFYKGVVFGLNKYLNDDRPKVVKVKSYSGTCDLFLGPDSWDMLVRGAGKYRTGSYLTNKSIETLLEDAKRGRDLRLAEKED